MLSGILVSYRPLARFSSWPAWFAKPAYDSFWSNTAFCRNVVGCLYRADVEAYVSACRAPALGTCAAFRSACEVQLGRLRDVCGLDV